MFWIKTNPIVVISLALMLWQASSTAIQIVILIHTCWIWYLNLYESNMKPTIVIFDKGCLTCFFSQLICQGLNLWAIWKLSAFLSSPHPNKTWLFEMKGIFSSSLTSLSLHPDKMSFKVCTRHLWPVTKRTIQMHFADKSWKTSTFNHTDFAMNNHFIWLIIHVTILIFPQ